MKHRTANINFRTTPDRKARWNKTAKRVGVPLTKIMEEHLDRWAKRVEKKQGANDPHH